MTKESIGSPEQNENDLLQSIVDNGKTIAMRLHRHFGQVLYPMKIVELPTGKIAYSNPGGDYPMSLRMHQVVDGRTAGVEVSLFFKALPGTDGQDLWLFENEQNKSNISDSNISDVSNHEHAYYFIQQMTDGTLATMPGPHTPAIDPVSLQSYSSFVAELQRPLEDTLGQSHTK